MTPTMVRPERTKRRNPRGVARATPRWRHEFHSWRWACSFPEFDLRWQSVHRRHGDPFPLPRLGRPDAASMLTRRVDPAFGALNQLAAAVFG